mgnify:CR=1 FL=1
MEVFPEFATDIITIGPAGENGVRFACISHDFGRQAGRTGIGLVLGAKNIKAIAVKGTGRLPVFDIEGAYAKGKDAFAKVKAKPGFKGWTPEGTAGLTNWANEVGVFPTRNFQTSYAEHYEQINGKAILDRLVRDTRELQDCGINSVAIMSNDPAEYAEDSFENMQRVAERAKFGFPYLFDETQQIARGGETNYIMATVTLYVAIYNLFTSLLHLFAAFGQQE